MGFNSGFKGLKLVLKLASCNTDLRRHATAESFL